MIFGREPARWIGLVSALVLAAIRILAGDDIISPDRADVLTNLVQKVGDLALLLAPWVTAELIRPNVYSPATVEKIQATAARTGEATGPLPPPP